MSRAYCATASLYTHRMLGASLCSGYERGVNQLGAHKLACEPLCGAVARQTVACLTFAWHTCHADVLFFLCNSEIL